MKWISRELQSRLETGKEACETCAMRDRCDSIRRDASIEKEWREKERMQAIKIANDRAEVMRAAAAEAERTKQEDEVLRRVARAQYLGTKIWVFAKTEPYDKAKGEPKPGWNTHFQVTPGQTFGLQELRDARAQVARDNALADQRVAARARRLKDEEAAKKGDQIVWSLHEMCERTGLDEKRIAARMARYPEAKTWADVLSMPEVVSVTIAAHLEIIRLTDESLLLELASKVKADG